LVLGASALFPKHVDQTSWLYVSGNVSHKSAFRKKTISPFCIICIFSLSRTAAGVRKAMTEQNGFFFYLESPTEVQLLMKEK